MMQLQIQKIKQKGEELCLQFNEFRFFVCWVWQMWFWAGCIWTLTGERAKQRKPSTVASSIQPHHSLVCQRQQYTIQNLDMSTTLHFYEPSWSPRWLLHHTLHVCAQRPHSPKGRIWKFNVTLTWQPFQSPETIAFDDEEASVSFHNCTIKK